MPVSLTSAASLKAASLLEQEGIEGYHLRVAVQPGGCSGLRYQLFFDDRVLDGDWVGEFGDLYVHVDRMSLPYLEGAVVDFQDTISVSGFTVDNPNASGACACGSSFY